MINVRLYLYLTFSHPCPLLFQESPYSPPTCNIAQSPIFHDEKVLFKSMQTAAQCYLDAVSLGHMAKVLPTGLSHCKIIIFPF